MKRRKFIEITGTATLITGSGWMAACSSWDKTFSEHEIKSRAIAAFKRFEEVWDFNDFWKRGNTFDACLCFVKAMTNRWPKDPEVKRMCGKVNTMLAENLDFFSRFDPGSLWADDFGWWGLMALNARKHLLAMGENELADKYYHLATDLCWEYKRKTAYDASPDAKPVPHGCHNGDANGQSQGVKNTVTNVLLFLLSSRIYRMNKETGKKNNDKYLEMAYRQWQWFDEWFKLDQYEYLKRISEYAALVQERPIAIFSGSGYTEKIHPPWAEGWVWTGDQGMLLAAMSDMLILKNELNHWIADNKIDPEFDELLFEQKTLKYIRLIGNGIKTALIAPTDKIIREAPCSSSFGPVHGNDYLAGRGIMCRYLGPNETSMLTEIDFFENFSATAEAIWLKRNTANNQFQPEFTSPENDYKYIEYFRKLWGVADEVIKWDIEKMNPQNRDGVCQSVGLDVFGALIRNLKKIVK